MKCVLRSARVAPAGIPINSDVRISPVNEFVVERADIADHASWIGALR